MRPDKRVIVKPLRFRARLSLDGVNMILPIRPCGTRRLSGQVQTRERAEPACRYTVTCWSMKSLRPIDAKVGARVRMRRLILGIIQTTVGEALGVSFQQVQKY